MFRIRPPREARPRTSSRGYFVAVALGLMAMVLWALIRQMGARASVPPQPRVMEISSEENIAFPEVESSPSTSDAPPERREEKDETPEEKERRLLAQVVDQYPLFVREQKEAYYYFLQKVHRMSQAEIEAAVAPEYGYGHMAGTPAIVRGSVVQVSGHLLRLVETPMNVESCGLERVWEGQVRDREMHLYSFVLTDPPDPCFRPGGVRPEDGIGVRLKGMFLQIIVYRTAAGKWQATPLIIGKKLELLPERVSLPPSWGKIGLALALAAGATLAWLIIRERRERPPLPHKPPAGEEGFEDIIFPEGEEQKSKGN